MLARYFDVRSGETLRQGAAWNYPHPGPGFEALMDRVAVYAAQMDECTVGEEDRPFRSRVGFYGGWVTSAVVGPFKGVPGSLGW